VQEVTDAGGVGTTENLRTKTTEISPLAGCELTGDGTNLLAAHRMSSPVSIADFLAVTVHQKKCTNFETV